MKVKPKVMSRAPAAALGRPSPMPHAPSPGIQMCVPPKGRIREFNPAAVATT